MEGFRKSPSDEFRAGFFLSCGLLFSEAQWSGARAPISAGRKKNDTTAPTSAIIARIDYWIITTLDQWKTDPLFHTSIFYAFIVLIGARVQGALYKKDRKIKNIIIDQCSKNVQLHLTQRFVLWVKNVGKIVTAKIYCLR